MSICLTIFYYFIIIKIIKISKSFIDFLCFDNKNGKMSNFDKHFCSFWLKNMKNNHEQEILSILETNDHASIEEIASAIFASPSTVRRRLTAMEQKGLLIRTHGGAQLKNEIFPSFSLRSQQNISAKKQIARSALKLIKNGDIIFLDGSTSAFFIAEYLKEFNDIRVITNGIDTLSLLSKNNFQAYSTGGRISEQNRSVLVGGFAETVINSLRADVAFFSAQAVGKDGEVYDCFEEENLLRKHMMKQAKKRVLLCDGAKLNRSSHFRLCNISEVDYIVSERDLSEYFTTENIPTLI